jgi:rieske iron-sulfur protein
VTAQSMPWPLARADSSIRRRTALTGALGAWLAAETRLAWGQGDAAARARPQPGDLLVRIGDESRKPLTSEDLVLGEKQVLAWPLDPGSDTVRGGSRLNKVLLLKLDPEGFDAPTKENAAEGVVAYSAICRHTGCEVTNWHADTQLLECPCHYSRYDPKQGAKVVSGPSPGRLAALPLTLAEGRLAVAKPFTGRLGFQQI